MKGIFVPAKVLWFTGLSGSGKTTIALELKKKLEAKGKKVKIFDGDIVRTELHKHLGFTPEDIKENNRLISELCLKHLNEFDFILVPIISPFRESRKKARILLGDSFVEVYVKAPLDVVIKRDVKGHYKKALMGEIKNFIGIDKNVPYEEPSKADIILDTEKKDVGSCVQQIIGYLFKL